jgi:SSS family solute:Na+ symporter
MLAIYGLHVLDITVVVVFLFGVIGLGWWASRSVKEDKDFYLGGRKFGKTLQFFLNFGNMTDSSGAPTTAAEVFRQGAGGIWISLQTLFITPFYWFTATWFRRARLVTMADLFIDRLNSKSLATAYVLFNIYVSLLLLGFGNVVSYKVATAMIVKPPAEYTMQEKAMVQEYSEYSALKAQVTAGQLPETSRNRYEELDSKVKRGQIDSFVSFVRPLPFYILYTLIVAIYITMGGLKAAAVTDALQGLLILAFTVLMIPLGIHYLGGFKALHAKVPEFMFRTFGTATASDYAWYSILAITFTSMIQIFGLMGNMANAGSAKDENAARFGQIGGAFTKRIVIIAWMMCGLIGFAMFPGGLADSESVWGIMSRELLGPGLLGLMIAGMLLGHMPAVGSYSISVAALIARNIYEPLVQGKDEKHYLKVGQALVLITLGLSIISSMAFSGAVELITTIITFNAFFGAVVVLILFWRRLSVPAVWVSLLIWIVLIGIVPSVVPKMESMRRRPMLLQQTTQRTVNIAAPATAEDVAAGKAKTVGQTIEKPYNVPSVAVYFKKVARANPSDPASPMEGVERFWVETYLLHLVGVPVQSFNKAGILAARWAVDGILPFVMLIVFSYLLPGPKRSVEEQRKIDGFYAKMKTPVAPTPEEDEREVALSYEQPGRFEHKKLFPGSTWEFGRWSRQDVLGFLGCWAVVLLILGFLFLMLGIGA